MRGSSVQGQGMSALDGAAVSALEKNISGMNFAPIVTSFDEPSEVVEKIFTGIFLD